MPKTPLVNPKTKRKVKQWGEQIRTVLGQARNTAGYFGFRFRVFGSTMGVKPKKKP